MKTVNRYGVEISTSQEMSFAKYINDNNIAPNTMTEIERTTLVNNYILGHK